MHSSPSLFLLSSTERTERTQVAIPVLESNALPHGLSSTRKSASRENPCSTLGAPPISTYLEGSLLSSRLRVKLIIATPAIPTPPALALTFVFRGCYGSPHAKPEWINFIPERLLSRHLAVKYNRGPTIRSAHTVNFRYSTQQNSHFVRNGNSSMVLILRMSLFMLEYLTPFDCDFRLRLRGCN